MITMITSTQEPSSNPANALFPTPMPIRTTPVPQFPTVTVRPILDQPVPNEPLTDPAGTSFTLRDFSGQIVIVGFWATWCPPCLEEMPLLQQFAQGHPDIQIVAITDPDDGQTMEAVQQFIHDLQLTDLRVGLDPDRLLFNAFTILNLPMTFVVDSTGIVRFRQIGSVTEEDLKTYLAELS